MKAWSIEVVADGRKELGKEVDAALFKQADPSAKDVRRLIDQAINDAADPEEGEQFSLHVHRHLDVAEDGRVTANLLIDVFVEAKVEPAVADQPGDDAE